MDKESLDPGQVLDGFKVWTRDIFRNTSDSLIDLVLTIFILIIVERKTGPSGLGVYSYFMSLYVMARYFSGWGIVRHVEVMISATEPKREEADVLMMTAERSILYSSSASALLFAVLSVSGAVFTRVDESAFAYVLVGLAVVLYNYNDLRISSLGGWGDHDLSVSIKFKRRIALFLSVIVLSGIGISPSYLVIAFLISELVASVLLNKGGYPVLYKGKVSMADIRHVFREGSSRLFVGDAIKFVLLADFFVLGMFVTSSDLGLYAEATVLGRLFLLVPISLRPVISQRLLRAAQIEGRRSAAKRLNVYIMLSFFFHSFAAIFAALHFRETMGFMFSDFGMPRLSVGVFLVLLPGLLAYSTMIIAESAYEVSQKVHVLRGITMTILALNLALNLYLVPYAGIYGAASATSLTLFAYLLVFGKGLKRELLAFKSPMITAGFSAYLLYSLLSWAETGLMADMLLVPAGTLAMYWLSGYFSDIISPDDRANEIIRNGGVNG